MNKQRGLKLFALFAFISILLILSSVLISAQIGMPGPGFNPNDNSPATPAFTYKDDRYYYDIESANYQFDGGKKNLSDVPWGAKDFQGFAKDFQPDKNLWDSFKEWGPTKYILGTGIGESGSEDNKNILQRVLGTFGYGNEEVPYLKRLNGFIGALLGLFLSYIIIPKAKKGWHLIGILLGWIGGILIGGLVGFISIILGGLICFGLLKILERLLKTFEDTSDIVKEILKWPLFSEKMTLGIFLGFYTLIFGLIFIALNFPIVAILKPLLWPLYTDFGSSLLPVFDPLKKLGIGLGIYIMRGIIFGIFTFLLIVLAMLITKGNKIISTIIINYQSEKRRIKAQERVDNLSYFAQAADAFAKAGKKPN